MGFIRRNAKFVCTSNCMILVARQTKYCMLVPAVTWKSCIMNRAESCITEILLNLAEIMHNASCAMNPAETL